ncbi:MAG: serine protease, partial [Roseomonas sp.]|nr:serine protease [Roseomonas sp.]
MLTRGPLAPGAGINIRPSENAGCRFDFRLVLSDGREIINRGMDICTEKVVAMQSPLPRPPGAAAPTPTPGAPPQARGRASTGTGFVVARDRV